MENETKEKKFAPGTKIVIVEDDKFLGSLVSKKLLEEGAEVKYVETGEAAPAVIESEMPAVIYLDLLLPGMSGFEILEWVRKNDKTKNIPVIVLSNLGERSDIQKGIELGATSFLIKASMTVESIMNEGVRVISKKK
ncbi:MAG: response regulator [bacterium]